MYLSVEERTALATLIALAFFKDLRVSSSALPYSVTPPTAVFPVVNSASNYLGYFEEREDTHSANKCNSTREPAPIAGLVGGDNADLGQFPWVAVVHRLKGGNKIAVCGATIISARWVLTAGHCVAPSPRRFLVAFGETDRGNIGYDYYNGPGLAMITTKGALHPQHGNLVNDIALLWMPRDITFNALIKPIRLAGARHASDSFVGHTALIVGWGLDGPSSPTTRNLKYGSVPIISNGECARYWNIDDRNLCTASRTGQDVCQGDSGGPLIVQVNREYLQIGVVSYGDDDCPSSVPGTFTRVSAFSGWIEQVTGIKY